MRPARHPVAPALPATIWRSPHPATAQLVDPSVRLLWRIMGRARDGAPIDRTIATRRPLVEPLVADFLADGARITYAIPDGVATDAEVPPQPEILPLEAA